MVVIGGSGGSGLPIIRANRTLYIATTGNDTTGNGSSGAPWLTVGKALDYLKDKWIPYGVTVTAKLGDGSFGISTVITIDHPCGGQINIVGTNTHAKTMSSVQSSSGSAGAWSVIINLNSVADITTDDYVNITGASGGTLPEMIEGHWSVTNVDAGNTRITVASSHNWTSAPSGAVAATVTVIKTRIVATGCSGLLINGRLGLLDKLSLIGDMTAGKAAIHGLATGATTYAKAGTAVEVGTVGINNWSTGIMLLGGGRILSQYGAKPCISKCTTGAYIGYGSVLYFPSAVFSGCSYGVSPVFGGWGYVNTATISGNSTAGVRGGYAGGSQCGACKISGNAIGAYALSNGYNYIVSATLSNNSTDASPAVNTLGNENGYNDS